MFILYNVRWTFDIVGLEVGNFAEVGAVHLHEFTETNENHLNLWPTNYSKLASATLFTLFFAGNDFAPKRIYNGQTLQDFLQDHYVECYRYLASRIKHIPSVCGFEAMNEPHEGYIGLESCLKFSELQTLHLGNMPNAFESFCLASGIPVVRK
jgi:hypothetical protein